MATSLLIISGALLIVWITVYFRKKYSYFSEKGILSPTPIFPLGNFWKVGITMHFIENINSIYKKFKGKDVLCGFYIFTKPCFLILDLDLVKNILVKDFYSFHDRGIYYNENTDPLSAHLFSVNFYNLSKRRFAIRGEEKLLQILSLSLLILFLRLTVSTGEFFDRK